MKLIYPDVYLKNVQEINIEFVTKNKLKLLILDVDNTLIDYDEILSKDVIKWAKDIQNKGVKLYILSNSNKKEKIKKVADRIKVKYKTFAKKPLKTGFMKIQKELDIPVENIGVVGDQIFTDVIGGNRCKMFTILVDPIKEKDYWYTAWKRPIENKIKRKIKSSLN